MYDQYVEDCKCLVHQMKQEEKDLRLRRRWLLGLGLSRREQNHLESLIPPNDKFVPEWVLREDDLSYESIKTFVEKTHGIQEKKRKHHVAEEEIQVFESPNKDIIKYIISLLDEMTNKGLFSLTEILNNGSVVNSHKTRKKMKKIVIEFLPKLLECHDDQSKIKRKQLKHLLTDPQYFSQNESTLSNPSQSFRAVCIDVLSRLEELPFVALDAMRRNLSEVKGYTPRLLQKRSGWSLKRLIELIRRKSKQMLREFGDANEPPEPLVKALAVAQLMLKPDSRTLFSNVSPDIEMLQTDIMSAIQLVQDIRKISPLTLKKLQVMLDPDAEASERSTRLRTPMKNLLTEYLLECSNMDTIPKPLLEAVRIILNRPSQKSQSPKILSTEEIQEEVNQLLNLSAQAKQIVWDYLPENEFDSNFAEAYMDDVDECCCDESGGSEIPNFISGHTRYGSNTTSDIYCQPESVGENSPVDYFKSPGSSSLAENCPPLLSPNTHSSIKLEPIHITETTSVQNVVGTRSMDYGNGVQTHPHFYKCSFNGGPSECFDNGMKDSKADLGCMPKFQASSNNSSKCTDGEKNKLENEYLIIQEACDETSMLAYSLVDHVFNGVRMSQISKAPKRKGFCDDGVGSVLISALELLMPSFPTSEKEELKVFLGI
ncbi:unnamed protein product [Cuscuta campestris]|uniref:Uncharacterized protein n=2 Tax=Cuscuta sect. Cleistogrammica TaxID=1824901 RepID=A0A484M8B8_9ASTE|nr:hypothetical protein DM860_007565 [Cuscuta australis]VFQ84799.1 unnamed protein product [Cuscuta campestris]